MKFYRMRSFILLRNFRVIALKLNMLFETRISYHFVTKNNLRGITMGIGPIWGSSSLTLYPLLIKKRRRKVPLLWEFWGIYNWSCKTEDQCLDYYGLCHCFVFEDKKFFSTLSSSTQEVAFWKQIIVIAEFLVNRRVFGALNVFFVNF